MELNMENIFQLTGKIILIAIVDSQTRTTQGSVVTVVEFHNEAGKIQYAFAPQ